jgi:Flp pilus assembly protein TadD
VVAVNNLALVLANRYGDPSSLQRARQLLQASPYEHHPAMRDTLGWMHYRLGDYETAIVHLKRAVAGMPGMPLFHCHLGMANHMAGEHMQAKRHLQRALEAGNFPDVDKARETLDRLEAGS